MAFDGPAALSLWEEVVGLSPIDRAVRVAASFADVGIAEAALWPVDERDRRLIEARREAVGPRAGVVAECPVCCERIEADVDLDPLLAAESYDASIDWNGACLPLRAPSSIDVARAAQGGGSTALAKACTGGIEADADAVAEALGAARPLLNVELEFLCAACGAPFRARFDIGAYFWTEIELMAEGMLDEIHALASAYHWSEADILAMDAGRRNAYLARLMA